jgi:pyruvate dehydrogenase E1 component alpha subunit
MQLTLGVPMADILRFRRGFPEFGSGHDRPILPAAVPIASQIPHAAGLGMAADYRGTDEAVVCCFGDGATSEGDFHEGLNFAGVFGAPVVFLCENNGWAISTPESRQTASARAGAPVLVESLTYRQGPHTTSDDPGRYEDRATFPGWRTRDPVERFVEFLREGGLLEAGFVESARETAGRAFDAAKRAAETTGADPDDLFEYAYESMPPALDRQRAELRARLERQGDPDGT